MGLWVQAACPHVALCTVFQFIKPLRFPGGTWLNWNKLTSLASLPVFSHPQVPTDPFSGGISYLCYNLCVCFPIEAGNSLGMDLNSFSFSYLSYGLGMVCGLFGDYKQDT